MFAFLPQNLFGMIRRLADTCQKGNYFSFFSLDFIQR
jgi:hypothetical protein